MCVSIVICQTVCVRKVSRDKRFWIWMAYVIYVDIGKFVLLRRESLW
jgi:hypothetical protein